jgi:hypothetical protein
VELYVGDFAIASIVDNILLLTNRADPQFSQAKSKGFWHESTFQVRRQVRIASHLRFRIESYVNDDTVSLEDFEASCNYEADALAVLLHKNYGTESLLHGIASGLITETLKHLTGPLAKPMLASFFEVKNLAQHVQANRDLERHVRRALINYSRASMDSNESSNSSAHNSEEYHPQGDCGMDDERRDLDSLLQVMSVPSMWQVLLEFNVNDVARTVREATRRVLDDCGADHDVRLRKAKALNALGHAFHNAYQNQRKNTKKEEMEHLNHERLQARVREAIFESVVKEHL